MLLLAICSSTAAPLAARESLLQDHHPTSRSARLVPLLTCLSFCCRWDEAHWNPLAPRFDCDALFFACFALLGGERFGTMGEGARQPSGAAAGAAFRVKFTWHSSCLYAATGPVMACASSPLHTWWAMVYFSPPR